MSDDYERGRAEEAQQQTQDMILERDQLLDVQKGLEAEVERLRAALREISLLEDDPLRASKTRAIIARVALRGEGE